MTRQHPFETTTARKAETEPVPEETVPETQRAQPGHALLQLQCTHGNRHVQRLMNRTHLSSKSNTAIHETAAEGTTGTSKPLPYSTRIQAAFGGHDLSSIRAHTDERAGAAAERIGAEAYAMGTDIVFRHAPSLHTTAHEAAHIIQQRQGVRIVGGIGQVDDSYERHADAVADAVMQGQSAESLLNSPPHPQMGPMPTASGRGTSIQFVKLQLVKRKPVLYVEASEVTAAHLMAVTRIPDEATIELKVRMATFTPDELVMLYEDHDNAIVRRLADDILTNLHGQPPLKVLPSKNQMTANGGGSATDVVAEGANTGNMGNAPSVTGSLESSSKSSESIPNLELSGVTSGLGFAGDFATIVTIAPKVLKLGKVLTSEDASDNDKLAAQQELRNDALQLARSFPALFNYAGTFVGSLAEAVPYLGIAIATVNALVASLAAYESHGILNRVEPLKKRAHNFPELAEVVEFAIKKSGSKRNRNIVILSNALLSLSGAIGTATVVGAVYGIPAQISSVAGSLGLTGRKVQRALVKEEPGEVERTVHSKLLLFCAADTHDQPLSQLAIEIIKALVPDATVTAQTAVVNGALDEKLIELLSRALESW